MGLFVSNTTVPFLSLFNFATVFSQAAKLHIKGDEIAWQVSILVALHHAGELKAAKSFLVVKLIDKESCD